MSKHYIPFPRPELTLADLELLIRDYEKSFLTAKHEGVKKFDKTRLGLLYDALEDRYNVKIQRLL